MIMRGCLGTVGWTLRSPPIPLGLMIPVALRLLLLLLPVPIQAARGCCGLLVTAAFGTAEYSEELYLQPLDNGKLVLAHFTFSNSASLERHQSLFPQAVRQLVQTQPLKQLDLSFTHGKWKDHIWGPPVMPTKPIGAELRAEFAPEACADTGGSCTWPETTDNPCYAKLWGKLTHALSGMFCSSLNFLATPLAAAGRLPLSLSVSGRTSQGFYGALPREAVCTENLTPWLKLLPCRDADGLAALLVNRSLVYGAEYHSLRTQLDVIGDTHTSTRTPQLLLTQTLSVVLRLPSHINFPSSAAEHTPWSLLGAIWRPEQRVGPCSVSAHSHLWLSGPLSAGGPADHWRADLLQEPPQWSGPEQGGKAVPPVRLLATQHVAGQGFHRGSIVTSVAVVHRDAQAGSSGGSPVARPLEVCVAQVVPWYIRVYLHSLSLTVDSHAVDWRSVATASRLQPSRDRKSSTEVEICMGLAPNTSQFHLSMDFDKAFLTVTEHPPDTQRGFDIPAALVTLRLAQPEPGTHDGRDISERSHSPSGQDPTQYSSSIHTRYSDGLLVQLALPDFSMPYNVTCFTSTLLAIYLGSILAALVRRPREDAESLARATKATRGDRVKKTLRLIAVGGMVACCLVILDKELQRAVGNVIGVDLENLLDNWLS